jgi:hypothetical protein
MARPLSTRALALRALRDPGNGAATRYQALLTIRPHVSPTEFDKLLRQFIAATPRGKQLRLAMALLSEIETGQRTQAEADARQRAEIDAVLRQCEVELAASKPGTLNVNPVQHTEPILGTPAVSLPDPDNGVLTTPVVAEGELAEQRADVLKRGCELAEKVLHQTDRCYRAVFNKQESARLDALQEKWRVFEIEALAVGIDVRKEFADKLPWLRRFPVKVDLSRLRRTMSVPELRIMLPDPPTHKKPEKDCSIWSGMPPGI